MARYTSDCSRRVNTPPRAISAGGHLGENSSGGPYTPRLPQGRMPIPSAQPAPQPPARPRGDAPAAGSEPPAPEQFDPVAAVFGVIFPGAGQVYLGQKWRGVFAAVGVLGLFLGGMLIGGISVIDRRDNPVWFIGQAMVGPIAFGVDYVHQHRFKVVDPATGRRRAAYPDETRDPVSGRAMPAGPGQGPPYMRPLGRVAELGTLFATIAGMMNLIVIFDAAWHARRGT